MTCTKVDRHAISVGLDRHKRRLLLNGKASLLVGCQMLAQNSGEGCMESIGR